MFLRRLAGVGLALMLAGCGSVPSATTAPTAASPSPTATAVSASPAPTPGTSPGGGVPAFDHIYLVVMENKAYRDIVGNSAAPYINDLIARYGLATSYTAVAHPSEPNYVALFSGSTAGVPGDGVYNLSGPSLADQLDAHGRSWRVYAQNMPGGCFTAASAAGSVDGWGAAGTYARKHNPAISFTSISGDPQRCAHLGPLAGFDPAASNLEMIIPNMTNDMHDGSVAQGDAFLKAFVPVILGSAAFRNSLLLITWDEGTSDAGGGGQVATIVATPGMRAGLRSAVPHSHYSLLRTIEQAWGLGCLNQSCGANDLREFFAAR